VKKLIHGSRTGFTLLEVVISAGLFMLFTGGALLMANASSSALRTGSTYSDLDARARRALAEVCDLLRLADAQGLWPAGVVAPASTHELEFQRALGHDGTNISWDLVEKLILESDPSDPDDGVDNDGDGLVDECRVVWIDDFGEPTERRKTLCHDVAESLDGEVPGNLVDDNDNDLDDERGFCIDLDGEIATVRLTLEGRDGDGLLIRSTVQRSVALRNTTN